MSSDGKSKKKGAVVAESPSLWKKAFTRHAKWSKVCQILQVPTVMCLQKEISDVVHWFRQILAVICGIACGVIPLKGFVGILSYGILTTITTFLYYAKYLGVEEEDGSGAQLELLQEGFLTSFALFLITWILTYNAIFFS